VRPAVRAEALLPLQVAGNRALARALIARRALVTPPEKAVWSVNTPQQFEFQHVVAAHEFGHILGIEHIDKPGQTGDAEYADTWEEASDIMGWGMTVTAHVMKPWIAAAKAYGTEMGMPGGGTWTVVDPP
jgi:hypothetical protein